ncbi:MAG: ComEA family DNA-binding protein [Nitrospiraceae bacterium]
MMKSLLIKLGMLAMTMGVVFWIGWQAPRLSVNRGEPVAGTEEIPRQTTTAGEAEKGAEARSSGTFIGAKTSVTAKTRHSATTQRGLLDLNRAAAEDLESLPGIGAVLAQRVIAYRKSVGGFQTVEELRNVKGIGSKKFNRIKQLVRVAALGSKEQVGNRPL